MDLVIITSANIRLNLIKEIVIKNSVFSKFWILEKLLVQSINDLNQLKLILLKRKNMLTLQEKQWNGIKKYIEKFQKIIP